MPGLCHSGTLAETARQTVALATLAEAGQTHYYISEYATTEVLPEIEHAHQAGSSTALESGYLVICWDDPVNLMQYVTHVFQTVFGWNRQKAERHMLEVHTQGKSVLAREGLEKAEFFVHQLQKYNLHATLECAAE